MYPKGTPSCELFCYRCAEQCHPANFIGCPHRKPCFDMLERQMVATEQKRSSKPQSTANWSEGKCRHGQTARRPAPAPPRAAPSGSYAHPPQQRQQVHYGAFVESSDDLTQEDMMMFLKFRQFMQMMRSTQSNGGV